MADLKMAIYVILMAIAGYVSVMVLGAAIDLVVAAFGIVGSLVVSVFKFSADRLKEQENELMKIKRSNYQELLKAIGLFVKDNNEYNLTVVHTESFAFASASVVSMTAAFLKEPSQEKLKDLLVAMRKDIGLQELSNVDSIVENIYRAKIVKSGLPQY